MSIELTSPAFDEGDPIPDRFSRAAGNVSPPLSFTGVPGGTVELALVVRDPDAPGGTFTHWIIAGLPPDIDRLEEGTLPATAVEGRNDFGDLGYGGPQPPPGDAHRYVFDLLALGDSSDLAPGATWADFHDAVQGKELARGQLTGHFATPA